MNIWKRLTRKSEPVVALPTHSFCETMFASGETPWHIRKLGPVGRKLGGGADTPSLCGKSVSWDLNVEITAHHLTHCCLYCRQIYKETENAK
jgi:hypothetical protein